MHDQAFGGIFHYLHLMRCHRENKRSFVIKIFLKKLASLEQPMHDSVFDPEHQNSYYNEQSFDLERSSS